MELAYPLTERQMEAARTLHARLTSWRETDAALNQLAERFPGFDAPATLLKVTAINALYGTNVYAIYRMAKHVERVLAQSRPNIEPWLLAEGIAALSGPDGTPSRRHLSFASKFAHFFLDSERYPIKDLYAQAMLRFHLGRRNMETAQEHPYRAYMTNHRRLKELCGLELTNRHLDHYLWLAGQYRTWNQNAETRLGRDVLALFENPTPEAAAELDTLLPSIRYEKPQGAS